MDDTENDTENKPILTPVQCRTARAALSLSQVELSGLTGLSQLMISNFENGSGEKTRKASLSNLRRAFEEAGIEFPEDGVSVRWANADTQKPEKAKTRKKKES